MYQIETDRLRLRPFREEDAPEHHRVIYGDAEVMRYLPGGVPRTLEQTQELLARFARHWADHGFGAWAVLDKQKDILMGQCGLQTLPGTRRVEVFYALGAAYWNQGYTTEAARAALRFGFEEAGLPEVTALAVPENVASRRVMVKVGMEYRGIVTDYYNTRLACYLISREAFTYGAGLYERSRVG